MNPMLKFHPLAEVFPLIEGAEFDALVADIKANGLHDPITLLDGTILDGRNRYRACLNAGVTPKFVLYSEASTFNGEFSDPVWNCPVCDHNWLDGRGECHNCNDVEWAGWPEDFDPISFVVSKNIARRHLNESQRSIAASELEALGHGGSRQDANLHLARTREQLADILNVSSRSIASAKNVKASGAPELVEAVKAGKVSVSAAADVATLPKQEQAEIVAKGEKEILEAAKRIRAQKAEVRAAENSALKLAKVHVPTGKYSTIVIDPPWDMEKIERDVRPNQVAFDYPTMTEEELAKFDVASFAHDDCHLFCWTTQKFLPVSLRLLEAWGFRYVLTMVWHKPGGFQPHNLPQYNCEFAVYARRGTPSFIDTKAFSTCFQAPRREHSRKPDEFYDLVKRVTDGPRIDVFSREARDGFEQYGNETSKFEAAE